MSATLSSANKVIKDTSNSTAKVIIEAWKEDGALSLDRFSTYAASFYGTRMLIVYLFQLSTRNLSLWNFVPGSKLSENDSNPHPPSQNLDTNRLVVDHLP